MKYLTAKSVSLLFTVFCIFGVCAESTSSYDKHNAKSLDKTQRSSLKTALQEDKLIASDGLSGDFFGKSVSLSGNRALIGADARDGSVANEGAAYVFEFDGTDWIETAKLTANDGEMNDLFGFSMSLLGDRAVIGAYASNDNGNNSGSIYVFDFDGIDWLLSDKLTPSDGALGDFFGYSLSLSQNRILVGSTFDDDNGGASGSAYVFDYDGSDWNETTKLIPNNGTIEAFFGNSVSLSGDRVLIGTFVKT